MTPDQRRLCIEVLGWNQTQFARFIDRDPATVRRWFSGSREPESRIDAWLGMRAWRMACDPPPGCEDRPCFQEFVNLFHSLRFVLPNGYSETRLQPLESVS